MTTLAVSQLLWVSNMGEAEHDSEDRAVVTRGFD